MSADFTYYMINFFDVDPPNEPENWYTWDGLFTLDDGYGNRKGRKEHFLGRIAKFSESLRCYQIWIGLNIIGIVIALIALYTCYFHFDYFHYRLSSIYANLGHAEAQHIIGERLLHGRGIEKNPVSKYYSILTQKNFCHLFILELFASEIINLLHLKD